MVLLGLVVVALHAGVLSWLKSQLPQFEPLAQMAQPLFTRQLEASVAPIIRAATVPAAPVTPRLAPQAAVARDVTASPPEPAASEPVRPPQADEPDKPAPQALDAPPAPAALADAAQRPAVESPGQPDPNQKTAEKAGEPATEKMAVAASASQAGAPATDDWPAATRLSYKVTGYYRGDVHGTARVQWQREGPPGNSRYQVQLDLHVLGINWFTMTSQGEIGALGLSPRVYEERRPGGVRRVWFEADALKLDDGRRIPLPQQAQDTASQFVELGHRFSTGREALQAGREVAIWLARPGGADLWTYDVLAEEVLQAGELGAVAALRLKPRPLANPRGNVMAEIWFAPRLQFLPVRVRISMGQEYGNEVFVDLLVERIEQAAK